VTAPATPKEDCAHKQALRRSARTCRVIGTASSETTRGRQERGSGPTAWVIAQSGARTELIAALPIDHIAQRSAGEVGAQIIAEEVNGAVPVFVTGARDMRRDQHSGVGPQPRRRWVVEFADIDVECRTAQTTSLQRAG